MVHEVVPEDVATARGQLVAIDLLTKLDGVEATTLRATTPEEAFPRIHRGTGTQEVSMRLVNIGRRLVSTRLRVSRNLRWPRVTGSRTCLKATTCTGNPEFVLFEPRSACSGLVPKEVPNKKKSCCDISND